MPSDRPIFVIGCARSGTTMLQLMIHSHRRLAMPPETRFLMPLFSRRVEFGDLRDPANTAQVAKFIIKRRRSRWRDLELDAEVVHPQLEQAPATIGSMIGTVFAAYAEAHGAARWGDKRPNYVRHVDRLLQLFPDAQIVHIVRDGRDSVSSLLGMPWYHEGFSAAVYKWREAMDVGEHCRKTLRPDQYYEFRYEDLVDHTRHELEKLCAFLDEDFDETMLESHKVTKVPEWKTWHPNTRQPPNASAIQRWRNDLTADQIRLFETVARRQLAYHGYEFAGRSVAGLRRGPSMALRSDWITYVVKRARFNRATAAAEKKRQAEYPYPIAAAITTEQRRLAREQGWLDDRLRDPDITTAAPADSDVTDIRPQAHSLAAGEGEVR